MTPKKEANNDATAIAAKASEWKAMLDDGLSLSEKAEFDRWIEEDPRHRDALDRFDRVWTEFDRPFQAGVTGELMEELNSRARRRRRRVISSASVLLLVLMTGLVWQWRGNAGKEISDRVADGASTSATLLTPTRQTLPDGSVVELKEGAEIAVKFTRANRRVVLLRGEAHFQVTKDPARSFIVSAHRVEARAIGTGFAVEIQPGSVEVIVTEGTVTVAPTALAPSPAAAVATPPAQSGVVLQASDRTVVELSPQSNAALTVETLPSAELADRLAWRVPRVEFTRTSLADAVAVLNGFSSERRLGGSESTRFVIADSATAATRVSGLFRADRTDVFISLLKNGLGIEAENRGGGEILLKLAGEQTP